jgi:tetratricopeptide (TPR) repeat protein
MSDHPILKWTPVQGATRYLVIIRGESFYWRTVVSGTELVYPDSAPRLQPDHNYKLIVEINDRSSSDEPGLGLGFSLLSSKEKEPIQQEEEQIEKLGLPDEPTEYLIAHLYGANGLYAEAIDRLERIVQQFKAAAAERLLGNLYMKISLPRQAESHYLKSLALSRAEQDEDGEMLERRALAYIYRETLGNEEAASQQLQAVLDLARKLGDEQTTEEVQKQLKDLRPST